MTDINLNVITQRNKMRTEKPTVRNGEKIHADKIVSAVKLSTSSRQ